MCVNLRMKETKNCGMCNGGQKFNNKNNNDNNKSNNI